MVRVEKPSRSSIVASRRNSPEKSSIMYLLPPAGEIVKTITKQVRRRG
jgi:hypothetical protein